MFRSLIWPNLRALSPAAMLALSACSATPPPDVELLSFLFGGPDKQAVHLDGYGVVTGADWAVGERFLASNPHLASSTPDYYLERGAPLAFSDEGTAPLSAVVSVNKSFDGDLVLTATGRLADGTELVWRGAVNGDFGEQEIALTPYDMPEGPYCGELTIDWSLDEPTGSDELTLIETTQHDLYISLGEPLDGVSPHHTALQLSCAAVGATTERAVTEAIWQEFESTDIRRARDDAQLYYYESRYASAWLSGLLLAQHGECHSWVQLMGHALAFHGVEANQLGIAPNRPRMLGMQIGSWAGLTGTHVVGTGPDGICDSTAAGDDLQPIAVGDGRPHTVAVERPIPAYPELRGDDAVWSHDWVVSGADGVSNTPADKLAPNWAAVVPFRFGQANGRAYFVDTAADSITLEGDDIIYNEFLLTGADGRLQTPPQPGLTDQYYTEALELGHGYSSSFDNTIMAVPIARLNAASAVGGDDDAFLYGITTGEDGIAGSTAAGDDEQLIPEGQGLANVPCVGPGSDGVLNTAPSGDDTVLDYSAYYEGREPMGPLVGLSAWPDTLVQAQGGLHSPRKFATHILIEVAGQIYDPSYGVGPYATATAWAQERLASTSVNTGLAIDGIYVHETFPPEIVTAHGPIAP